MIVLHKKSEHFVCTASMEDSSHFIPDQYQRYDESDAQYEAQHLSNKRVEPAQNEDASEYRGANVAGGEDGGWVPALDPCASSEVGINRYTKNRPSCQYSL